MEITIKGELIDFNTFQNKTRTNKFAGSTIKKAETERVYWECKKQPLSKIKIFPVYVSFHWYMKNKKKDLDNVAFAKKFILDGLVMAGVIPNDTEKYVAGFSDNFHIDKNNPRVIIKL